VFSRSIKKTHQLSTKLEQFVLAIVQILPENESLTTELSGFDPLLDLFSVDKTLCRTSDGSRPASFGGICDET
jgi:hypothetical protein